MAGFLLGVAMAMLAGAGVCAVGGAMGAGVKGAVGAVSIGVPDAVCRILRPPEDLTVSEWCDRHRHLDKFFCAEPGPWRTERIPWIREIQDSFADPEVGSIIFVKGSRVGGTEAMNNMLAWSADARPMPAMLVLPRKPDVQDELTGRIRKIFEGSTRLRQHIPGGNWATEEQIDLDGMTIYGAAANTAGDLIRKTVGIAFYDEVDNVELAFVGLGDVWSLVEKRLTTFGHRAKLVGVSTPSTEEGAAWKQWLRSDQRQYHVPCPRCGTYQTLAFERLVVEPATERDPDRIQLDDLMRYVCCACEAPLRNHEKEWMVARGIWVPAGQQVEEPLDVADAELCARAAVNWKQEGWRPSLAGTARRTRDRGYWMNSLYSTLGLGWSKIFAEFLRVKDDREKFRVFVNQVKAEPWKENVVVTQVDQLRKKTAAAWSEAVVPPRAVKLLAAADVQMHCLYYGIRAYGPEEQSWLIRHGTCESFEDFYRLAFETPYRYADSPETLFCDRAAIDTRYRRDEALDFCGRHSPDVLPIFGYDVLPERYRPRPTEYYPGKVQRNPHSILVYDLNTSYYKTKLHRLMRVAEGLPGHWGLYAETSEEYFRQVTAEHLVWRRKKKSKRAELVWEPKREGMANHYGDVEVYLLALADIMNVRAVRPREVMVAQKQQQAELARRIGARQVKMPDGRPFFITQRK